MQIKNILKIILIFIILIASNIVFSKNTQALSDGVEKVEIEDWTKTREIYEVEGEEKKLNSEIFTDIENIDIDSDEVEILTGLLYQEGSHELRSLKTYNSKLTKGDLLVQGNKILRGSMSTNLAYHPFKISTMATWLIDDNNPNNINWVEGEYDTSIITWPCYSKYINNNSISQGASEYRMLEGEFVLSEEQISLIRNKKVQAVLGVSTNDEKGFETIIPFNDLIGIYINNDLTQLHYKNSPTGYYTFNYIPENSTKSTMYEYTYPKSQDGHVYCDSNKHNLLSSHIAGKHIDLNILSDKSSNNFYPMKGDIGLYLNKRENNIKILIGQQIDTIGDISQGYGGISKLDLFLIKNPQLKVELNPYFMINNQKLYLDNDYLFTDGDTINYDIEIKNNGEIFPLENLKVDINFIVGEKDNQNKITETLRIDANNIIYKNEDITTNVDLLIKENENSDPISTSLLSLKYIKTGESIILSSDNIKYLVNEYNGINKNIEYNYVSEFNYLDNYFFYKYEGKGNYRVNELKGSVDIVIECENDCSDYFYAKIEGENQISNVKLRCNESHKISNLDLNKNYKIVIINDSAHQNIESKNVILTEQNRNKNIRLRTSRKYNNYFIQRKIQGIGDL